MHPRLHFTLFLTVSLALHALVIAALFLIKPARPETPLITPVKIVNLPPQAVKQLPPLESADTGSSRTCSPAHPVPERFIPEKPLPPSAVPMPKKFGTSEEIKLPKTMPRTGVPEGAEQGKETGKTGAQQHHETGPLPFLPRTTSTNSRARACPKKDRVMIPLPSIRTNSNSCPTTAGSRSRSRACSSYPELAAISGYQGTLYILFDIMKDGSLGRLEVLKSSGYKILDDEALRSIRDSAPFQPLPDEWNMEQYSIRAAVLFYLNETYIR